MRRTLIPGLFACRACLALCIALASCSPDEQTDVPGPVASAAADRTETTSGDPGIRLRRVWEGAGPDFYVSEPSPDGRYLTEADWTTGDLAVIDLLTGELKRITDKGTWSESGDWAESGVFSPDGERIAYLYFDNHCPARPCNYQMRVIGVDGSNEHVLVPGHPDFYAILYGWSGDEILAMVWGMNEPSDYRVGMVSAVDGSIRTLYDFGADWRWSMIEGEADLSLDGRYAAFDYRARPGGDADIRILSGTDGRELGRIDGPYEDRILGFTPDGRGLLFASDRGGTEGLWHQPLEAGRPTGDPVLLRSDIWRAVPVGVSRDALFFGIHTQAPGIHLASIDAETGALRSEPAPVEPPSGSRSSGAVWSPDGRRLAYFRVEQAGRPASPQSIVIRSVAGDDVRQIPLPYRLANLELWTEDGSILTLDRSAETGKGTVFEVDLETGHVEPRFTDETGRIRVAALARSAPGSAGPVVYFQRFDADDAGTWALVGRDLSSGVEWEVLERSRVGLDEIRASPDGNTLALMLNMAGQGGAVITVSSLGGAAREVHRGWLSDDSGFLWAPDSRHFFFLTWTGDPPVFTRWRGDAITGTAEKVSDVGAAPELRQARLHPDGRLIAFEAGELRGEIWKLSNLPGQRAVRPPPTRARRR